MTAGSPRPDRCQRCERKRILDHLGLCRRCFAELGPVAEWSDRLVEVAGRSRWAPRRVSEQVPA